MPSVSKKQHRFMKIAASNEKFAKKFGISQKVAREWLEEDERLFKANPNFYDLLPESADDTSFQEPVSMEGVFKDIFNFIMPPPKVNPIHSAGTPREPYIFELCHNYSNPAWADHAELKTGTVSVGQAPRYLHFERSSHLLTDLEREVNRLSSFMHKAVEIHSNAALKVQTAYMKAKTLPYAAATDLMKNAVAEYHATMDKIGTITSPFKGSKGGTPIQSSMEAYDKAALKKLASIAKTISVALDEYERQVDWDGAIPHYDFKDEDRWWRSKYTVEPYDMDKTHDVIGNIPGMNFEFGVLPYEVPVNLLGDALRGIDHLAKAMTK